MLFLEGHHGPRVATEALFFPLFSCDESRGRSDLDQVADRSCFIAALAEIQSCSGLPSFV